MKRFREMLTNKTIWLGMAALLFCLPAAAQNDLIRTGTGIGAERTRLAVSSFFASPENAPLTRVFDDTLWNDLDYAGIFELASRSMYPLGLPSRPTDIKLEEWPKNIVPAGALTRLEEVEGKRCRMKVYAGEILPF